METPYRNNKMLEDLVAAADDNTLLCIAADITLPSQYIKTKPVKQWRKALPDLHKRPCIYILGKE